MLRLPSGDPYPSIEEEALCLEEMRAMRWWFTHCQARVRALAGRGDWALTREIRRRFYEREYAAIQLMGADPRLTASQAREQFQDLLYPSPER